MKYRVYEQTNNPVGCDAVVDVRRGDEDAMIREAAMMGVFHVLPDNRLGDPSFLKRYMIDPYDPEEFGSFDEWALFYGFKHIPEMGGYVCLWDWGYFPVPPNSKVGPLYGDEPVPKDNYRRSTA